MFLKHTCFERNLSGKQYGPYLALIICVYIWYEYKCLKIFILIFSELLVLGNPDSESKHSRITPDVTLEDEGNYMFFINNELHQLLILNGGGRTLCTVVAEFVDSLSCSD